MEGHTESCMKLIRSKLIVIFWTLIIVKVYEKSNKCQGSVGSDTMEAKCKGGLETGLDLYVYLKHDA